LLAPSGNDRRSPRPIAVSGLGRSLRPEAPIAPEAEVYQSVPRVSIRLERHQTAN
jgi:hypothetical protein